VLVHNTIHQAGLKAIQTSISKNTSLVKLLDKTISPSDRFDRIILLCWWRAISQTRRQGWGDFCIASPKPRVPHCITF
jgi:hypothetical protein